ncbi:hypothetical protein CTZ27_36285 [Streptomyces griseocarneus]|nr:hypothetical protein CTZ27_36285 [Streptomyces griseocarneus]
MGGAMRTAASESSFAITAPAGGAVLSGPMVLQVSLGDLIGVDSVEYLLGGRQMYADGELVLPRRDGPSYELDWHTANWFDGQAGVEAVARDSRGDIIGRTALVPFTIANGIANVRMVSPDPTTTLSGTVPWTLQTDNAVVAGGPQFHWWHYYVDGKDVPLEFDQAQRHTHMLDTTRLRNGPHELWVFLELADARFAPYPVLGGALVTVNVDNGHTPMELRANFKDVFLVPDETVGLTARLVHTDGIEVPATATYTSSDPDIAAVGTTGEVTARAEGFADITASSDGFTAVTRAAVRSRHDFPHFSRTGGITDEYGPDSMIVRTMMFTSPDQFTDPRNPGLLEHMRQAAVNALDTGFYATPADGATRDFEQWKNDTDRAFRAITDLGLNVYLTGDSFARTAPELHDSICESTDPAVCPQPTSQEKIRYALSWAADTPQVLGIDMVDEIDGQWGDTPTPTDGRWSSRQPPLPDDAFIRLMAIMNSVTRPPVTWTCLGGSPLRNVKNWTGNPAFSDYNGIYHAIRAMRRAYPSGPSLWEIVDGMDFSTIERRDAYLPHAPSLLVVSVAGPDYVKKGPGNHYTAGQDILINQGTHAPDVAAQIVHAHIRGMAGVRVFPYDNTAILRDVRARTPPGSPEELSTGAAPDGAGVSRWASMSDAFNLGQELEANLLQPRTHAPDLGEMVVTGARKGPDKTLLMALNISAMPQDVTVDLTPYGLALTIRRTVLLGASGYASITQPWTPSSTVTLPPGAAAFWEIPHGIAADVS